MRLYLVKRTDNVGRDEYRSAVIAARCEGDVELETQLLTGFRAGNFTTEQIAARTNQPAGLVVADCKEG